MRTASPRHLPELFENSFRITESGKSQEYQAALKEFTEERQEAGEQFELVELFQALSDLCAAISKKIVLMIDEVDSATNNQVFWIFWRSYVAIILIEVDLQHFSQ